MTDAQIIEDIISKGYPMERTIKHIYENNFKYVYSMLKRHRLSEEDVINAYADSIVQLKNQILQNKFKGKSKISTYLYSILNNKCIDIIRGISTNINIVDEIPDDIRDNIPDIVDVMNNEDIEKLLNRIMRNLGSKCIDILNDWNNGFNMEEIAERNGLLNAHVARSKRYSCFQQLMDYIVENPSIKEQLMV